MDASLHFGAWLLTYAIHSTLVIGAVWLWVRLGRSRAPGVRELLWKAALVGGFVTTLAQGLLPFPHWGEVLLLARQDAVSATDVVPQSVAAPEGSAAIATLEAQDRLEMAARHDDLISGAIGWLKQTFVDEAGLLWLWAALVLLGLLRMGCSWFGLLRLRRGATRVHHGEIAECAHRIQRRLGSRRPLEIWITPAIRGPMAAGLTRWRLFLPQAFLQRLDAEQREAVIAHELAHLARGDNWWLAAGQWIACLFFFQPLNRVVRRHLRTEAEYLADRRALQVLPDEMGLVRALVALGEWLVGVGRQPVFHPLATGMGACRSTLGKRVELLLEDGLGHDASASMRRWVVALAVSALLLIAMAAPRAVASNPNPQSQPNSTMKSTLTSKAAALLAGTALFAAVPAQAENEKPAATATIAALPETLHGFSGHLSGKLISKDVDGGSLVMQVNKLLHVWKNNKSAKPEDIVGRSLTVTNIHSRSVDVLVTLQPGDHFEIEVKHVNGDTTMDIGEGMKKVSAPDASESSASASPREAMHGFRGIFVGTLVEKDQEKGTLAVKIERIARVWKQNTAKNAEAAAGQTWKINGVSGKWLDTLLTLKVGDRVEVEAFHHRGDELSFVGEWLKKAGDEPAKEPAAKATGGRADLNGFRGLLVGKLLSKDIEKGEVEIEVDTVKTVFKKSTAPHPESAVGQKWRIQKIAGKFLDNLLIINVGERIELAAFHNHGEAMDFPGELLRKAE